jgi:hypothetical protein
VGNAQLVEKLPPRGNPFSVSRVSTGDRREFSVGPGGKPPSL